MSDDIKNTKMLIGIMKSIYNNNYAAASKFYMGEIVEEAPKEVSEAVKFDRGGDVRY